VRVREGVGRVQYNIFEDAFTVELEGEREGPGLEPGSLPEGFCGAGGRRRAAARPGRARRNDGRQDAGQGVAGAGRRPG
jgi:hypothetical protein